MAESSLPKGLIIDSITPLKEDGEIDGRSLGRHLDRVLPHAQAVLIAGPCMGEGRLLSPEQREDLFDKSLVIVRGKVPVLVWICSETVDQTVRTINLLKKRIETRNYTGQIVWVDTPLYYHSNRGLPEHYDKLTSLVADPFIIHNDPALIKEIDQPLKRNNIRTSVLKEIAKIDRIGGLIFSGSLERANNYQKAVRPRSYFPIYDGDESRFLGHPSISGVVSAGANLAPRMWQKITASSINQSGEDNYPDYLRQVWDAGRYLNELRNIYQDHGAPLIKYALSDMGIIDSTAVGNQNKELTKEREEIKTLMQSYSD